MEKNKEKLERTKSTERRKSIKIKIPFRNISPSDNEKKICLTSAKMWTNEESFQLIDAVQVDVIKSYPVASVNNNHEFIGNLFDIPNNWNDIADKIDRSG